MLIIEVLKFSPAPNRTPMQNQKFNNPYHNIDVWHIYLHLVDFYGKFRESTSPMDAVGSTL